MKLYTAAIGKQDLPSLISNLICRLLAIQRLDQKGMLDKLRLLTGKNVLCYILKTHCELQATYGALRGNDLQADFVRKPYLHELLYVIEGLRENYGSEKVLETVMRYGKLLEVGHDDLTALKKLGSWPLNILSKLTAIFKLFEAFQTEDA